MAKRLVKWIIVGAVLSLCKALEDPKATAVIEVSFDLTKIFPDFNKLTDVQQQIVIKGTKEKLSDTGASQVADSLGKIANAKKQWADLEAGKWTGERINATGAAENKAKIAKIKEVLAGPVTMQGLMMKQLMNPTEFTEEDQAKLDEFIQIAAKNMKKK